MDPHLTHFMNPPVEMRGLLQREVPPDKLEGTIARYLLPSGDEMGDIGGIDEVALLIGSGVHVRATHTPMLLVPRVAQIDSLPIKIQIRLARGQRTRPNHQS